MDELIATRYNLWWFLSFIVPAIVMIFGTYFNKKPILIIAIILSIFLTYTLCNLSVREKWLKRYEIAITQEELKYAQADGANLVFTAIVIGPFEAILYTSFWSVFGCRLWKRVRFKRKHNNAA